MSFHPSTKTLAISHGKELVGDDSKEFSGDLCGLPLGTTDPSHFRTRHFTVRQDVDGSLHLTCTSPNVLSFQEMLARRSDPANIGLSHADIQKELLSESGFSLSNVGVSVAVEVSVDDRRFAVLVASHGSHYYKLISGYCDIGGYGSERPQSAAELVATAGRELAEELIIGRISHHHVVAVPLSMHLLPSAEGAVRDYEGAVPHYTQNFMLDTKHPSIRITPKAFPRYLAGTFGSSSIIIDGIPVEARFYLDRRYRSGQIVFSYTVDLKGSDLTLLHAEDSYCSESGLLESVLYPDGLILAELSQNEALQGDFFRFREGRLIRTERDNKVKLSEAFTTCSGTPGIIDRGAISLSEYLLNQRAARDRLKFPDT